jgi:hypothetical protein
LGGLGTIAYNVYKGNDWNKNVIRNTLIGGAAGAGAGFIYSAATAAPATTLSLTGAGAGAAPRLGQLVNQASAAGTNLPDRIYALGRLVGNAQLGSERATQLLQQGITKLGGEFGKEVINGTTYLVGPRARNGIYNAFRIAESGSTEVVKMKIVEGVMKVIE